jgi:hypothetical protein
MAEKKADSKKKDESPKDETPTALIESETKHDGNPKPGEGAKSATSNAAPAEASAESKAAEPKAAEPKAEDKPAEPKAEDKPAPRAHAETIGMPLSAAIGAPPALPAQGGVEHPTSLPGPTDIPTGDPTSPAAAPGHVPPGDSRSLRKGSEFALIYRQQTHVITRTGTVGTRGAWRVVEYPTVAMASTSYARECSKFVGDGFSDYR